MKIIGMSDSSKYICEVSHGEIEKFLDLYYNKMERLAVGESVNLGAGYDYDIKIRAALEKTENFIKSSGKIMRAIADGICISHKGGEKK